MTRQWLLIVGRLTVPESTRQENTNQRILSSSVALSPLALLSRDASSPHHPLEEQLGKKLREVAAITTCHTGKGDQIHACQSDRSWGRWHRLQSKTCQSQKGEESIKSTVIWSQKVFFSTHKEEQDFALLIFKVENKGISSESLDTSISVSN